jgi:hypothetical protein
VLQWLSNNSRDAVVAKAVVDTLRASVMQTREAATASPTARSTQSYRSAEDHLARANRLASSARPLESLRALWQAADAYASSLNAPSVQATSPAEPQPAAPAAVLPPSPAPPPTPTADVSSTAAAPVSSTTAPRPLPTPTPTAEDGRPSDSQTIANTLRSYDAAYRALDVEALLKVFPSLGRDQVDTLRRTFAGMSTYEMETRVTRVDVNNDSASVVATVARRMTPRVGNPVVNDVETEFQLRRSGRDWVIVGVRVR